MYFTRFRVVHDELECLAPNCSYVKCTCSINAKLDAHDLEVHLSQFLMGFNDYFILLRGQILLMNRYLH